MQTLSQLFFYGHADNSQNGERYLFSHLPTALSMLHGSKSEKLKTSKTQTLKPQGHAMFIGNSQKL